MNQVAAVVPTAIQRGGHRDDGRHLPVGCALAAQRSFACGELRGERATYVGTITPSAKGAR